MTTFDYDDVVSAVRIAFCGKEGFSLLSHGSGGSLGVTLSTPYYYGNKDRIKVSISQDPDGSIMLRSAQSLEGLLPCSVEVFAEFAEVVGKCDAVVYNDGMCEARVRDIGGFAVQLKDFIELQRRIVAAVNRVVEIRRQEGAAK